jgi:hypothetical protein
VIARAGGRTAEKRRKGEKEKRKRRLMLSMHEICPHDETYVK